MYIHDRWMLFVLITHRLLARKVDMSTDIAHTITKIRQDIGSRLEELTILADIPNVTEDQAFFNESMRIIIRDEIIDFETQLKIYQRLSKIIEDYRRLSETIEDYRRLLKFIGEQFS